MVYCVGLTGGIGCGKSTVAHLFAERGAAIIDTDAISHTLTDKHAPGMQAIVQAFGSDFVQADGELNRSKLRTLIFSNPQAKQQLENILHPMIHQQALAALATCTAPYALLVVPLLFETGRYLPLVQRKLVVDCGEATQIQRTMARSQLRAEEVQAIMATQLDRAERLRRADDVLNNEGSLHSLENAVTALDQQYRLNAQTYAKT